jgi:DUF4097 and DUF4098 domain-containing protein YvlB
MGIKRIGLLTLILAFGGSVELLYQVRGHLDVGPWGVRVIGGRFFGPHFAFEAKHDEASAPVVEVRNAFGAVKTIESTDGAIHLTLRKVVFLPDEAQARTFADRIHVVTERDGDTLRVRTNREDLAREDDETGFETHLELALPRETRLVARTEHSAVTTSRILAADVEASFEPVEVEDIVEDVRVKTQHAPTTVRRVGAAVTIEARHGNIHVEDVTGPVSIDAEHGSAEADRVGPLAAQLSHGDLNAQSVRGDLRFRGSHSGVEAKEVSGSVDVITSFDSVVLEGVGSDARVECEHGRVRLVSVRGGVTVKDKFGALEIEGADGPVEFSLEHGEAQVKGARRGVTGRTVKGAVGLDGFEGPVALEVEGGHTRLIPASTLSDAVRVTSRRGDITIIVPPGSRFSLSARAMRGEIDTDGIDGLTTKPGRRGEPSFGQGEVGGGGETVNLETDGGSIHIETGSPAGH